MFAFGGTGREPKVWDIRESAAGKCLCSITLKPNALTIFKKQLSTTGNLRAINHC